jgi:mannosyltransferase
MSAGVVVDDAAVEATVDGQQAGRARGFVAEWWPAAVFAVVAGALSLPRLGTRSLWLDEAYTVGATNELIDTWLNTAGTQALYYLLVWPASRISTDPAWLRLPSALLAMVGVVVTFRVALRIGGRMVAILATGGLALSWGLARYSLEARSYTLAMVLVAASWLALIAALQSEDEATTEAESDAGAEPGERADPGRRWWWTFYVLVALIPLTHGLAALNYVAQLGALAIIPGDADDRRLLLRRALRPAPVLAAELACLFLLGANDIGNWVPPLSWWQMRIFKQLYLGFDGAGVVLGVLVAAAVIDLVRTHLAERSRESWLRLLPVFWALGPALIIVVMSLVRPYAAARYIFPSLPAVFLLVALLLVRWLGTTWRPVLAGLLLVPLLALDQRHVTTDGIEAWRELTDCIAVNMVDGDRLVTAASHRPALDYYWNDHPELAGVEPLSPTDPLGPVRRFYDADVDDYDELVDLLLEDPSGSIWYVDRMESGRLGIVGLAFDADVATEFKLLSDPWYFEGDLTLTRLDPLDAPPRERVACDTVATPDDMLPPE